jgi:hypothetical protein
VYHVLEILCLIFLNNRSVRDHRVVCGQNYKMNFLQVLCTPCKVLLSDKSTRMWCMGHAARMTKMKKCATSWLVRKPEDERSL